MRRKGDFECILKLKPAVVSDDSVIQPECLGMETAEQTQLNFNHSGSYCLSCTQKDTSCERLQMLIAFVPQKGFKYEIL